MLDELLFRFPPISLDEMSSVKLMNRTDTKFLTTVDVLMELLGMARDEYYAQEIDGVRNATYQTAYYDTGDCNMFYDHIWGHTNRQKIRFRTYVGSGLQFMEVKTKNNHGRTKKKRMEVTDTDLGDPAKLHFLSEHLRYAASLLQPAVENRFHRITLVNRGKTERLTIDTDVNFRNLSTGATCSMGPLCIIELKRDGRVFSPILEKMWRLRIHPHGFSKYCFGLALTSPQLPANRLKPKMADVRKLLAKSDFTGNI